ncbi:MAG: pyridoxamine 5'-phosphate oxidase family protein [Campylobacteraceae bacterium]|jgi:nitroimidazol reductase NimA-like FMN-containing flavoprotein (pyridoxamine 5'-phosphate oxidase superfamily)|nr:pyridoxamine 5'-phosphate oxidase family protein [Campylobacteraceae bacterium]
MRRDEFDIKDTAELEKLLNEVSFGTICFNDQPFPYMTGINFVFKNGCIYFHGATQGRKYSLALKNPFVSFSAVKEYAFIPSNFFKNSACSATQYFASAFFEGELSIEKDKIQKAAILELLMKKYQKSGKYESLNHHVYDKMLDKTAVFRLKINSHTLKIKVGQNLSKEQILLLIEKLKNRGEPKDLETVELIKRVYPENIE